MHGKCVCAAFAICLVFGTSVFGQVGINASLGGAVSDASGAVLPGVEVTAKNVDTGVVSTNSTNECGAFRCPSLQPGDYEVSAGLPGFRSQAFKLALGTAEQIRQ